MLAPRHSRRLLQAALIFCAQVWLAALALLVSPVSSDAIVRRDDRPDSLYRSLAREFDTVARVGGAGVGTLIARE